MSEEFVDLAGATIRNVSRGIIGIAILQALLAGIGLLSPQRTQARQRSPAALATSTTTEREWTR